MRSLFVLLLVACVIFETYASSKSTKNQFFQKLLSLKRRSRRNATLKAKYSNDMMIKVKSGARTFVINCERPCQRIQNGEYKRDCSILPKPNQSICGFCRIVFRCQSSKQIFQ